MKKIVIAGGSGFLGSSLKDHYNSTSAEVVILTRNHSRIQGNIRFIQWDGQHNGAWSQELEGADALINLNGKSVDCRYTEENKALIYSSRLDSTSVLGRAVKQCVVPPKVWINASSATIYRHSLDRDMDEYTGEPGTGFSVDVCQKWESAFWNSTTPHTRKVIIRTAIVLGRNGGALKPLKVLARLGLGGTQGSGDQYVSWLHESDFVSIIDFIISHVEIKGVYNLSAPNPIPNNHFMKAIRKAINMPVGVPMPVWLLKVGAILIRTEPELILKSRRVIPRKLMEAGYRFKFDQIESALHDLLAKTQYHTAKTISSTQPTSQL